MTSSVSAIGGKALCEAAFHQVVANRRRQSYAFSCLAIGWRPALRVAEHILTMNPSLTAVLTRKTLLGAPSAVELCGQSMPPRERVDDTPGGPQNLIDEEATDRLHICTVVVSWDHGELGAG